MIIYIKSV